MRKRILVLLVFAGLMIAPQIMLSFGPKGHRIVAEIAVHYLTPKAKKAIALILEEPTFNRHSLARLATWPDDVRSDPYWNPQSDNITDEMSKAAENNWNHRLNNTKWHFATYPDADKDPAFLKEVPANLWDGLIMNRIQRCEAVLRGDALDPAFNDKDSDSKRVALTYLVHLIGDLHQPLHVGNGKDRGGNNVFVEWFGKSSKLHVVWDTELIENSGFSFTEYAEVLMEGISTDDVKNWSKIDPLAWAQESARNRETIYKQHTSQEWEAVPKLSYSYAYKNGPMIEDVLRKGGVRLAALLNDIFK